MTKKPAPKKEKLTSIRSLANVKEQVQKKYLGQARIHGVGLRSKDSAVRLYAVRENGDEQTKLLENIRSEIAPYALDVVFDEAPVALNEGQVVPDGTEKSVGCAEPGADPRDPEVKTD